MKAAACGLALALTLVAAPVRAAPIEPASGAALTTFATTFPVSMEREIDGWMLGAYADWTTRPPGPPPLRRPPTEPRRDTQSDAFRAAGLSDLDVSAMKSFSIGRRLSLDLAAEMRLPTGSERDGLGAGRTEAMLDAGLSTNAGKWELWTGAARRLRGASELHSGRDVWEIYGGAEGRIGARATLRFELERRQAAYSGGPAEVSARLSLRRKLARGISLTFAAARESDEFGSERLATVALRWQLRPH
jgi:hypothetical protein